MFRKIVFICLFAILCLSCKKENITKIDEQKITYKSEKLKGELKKLNISILLDLSDRIKPKKPLNSSVNIAERDVGYIKSIAECFEIYIRNKRNIKIDDRIQLFIDPEPSDRELNRKIDSLKISFTRDNAKRNLILQTSKKYENVSQSIYHSAIKDNNYVGSDIWRFFKNKVKDYCIEDGYRNILVILTDGYIYHNQSIKILKNRSTYLTHSYIKRNKISENRIKEKDFGFINSSKGLENLEILILGVNPVNGSLNDEEVIHSYFSKWFKEMEVKKYKINNTDLPSNMDKIIRKFIFEN
jgi:hypothetical protein